VVNKITPLTSNRPVVENGTQTQEMRAWSDRVTDFTPILGSGAPDSDLEGYIYIDLDGTDGNILYIQGGNGWKSA